MEQNTGMIPEEQVQRSELYSKDTELPKDLETIRLPRWLSGKESSACNAGDLGSISGSGKSPGGGNGNPLQGSCLWTEESGGLQSMVSQRGGHD